MQSSQQLRELVDNLHPRSPKEVMGEAANSSLLGSTIAAALSTLVLLIGATIVVLAVGGGPETKSEAATTAATPASIAKPDAKTAEPESVAATQAANDSEQAKPASDTDSAVEALGIGETKDATSEPESLENRLDQLLDGLE